MAVRLFIATPLPQELRERIGLEVSSVRRGLSGSWPRPETYHLTYAFLDEQPPELVPRLDEALRISLGNRPRFSASVGSAGFFPTPGRPRVGWIALEPREPFAALAEGVRHALRGVGLDAESRAFVPHLTIVRIKDSWDETATRRFGGGLAALAGSRFDVSVVAIYESRLGSSGATHTELRRVELAQEKRKG